MPTIYIPSITDRPRCENNIDSVCKTIEKTINQTIQNTLNTLEKDCSSVTSKINDILEEDGLAWKHNLKTKMFSWMFGFLSFLLMTFLAITFIADTKRFAKQLGYYLGPVEDFWTYVPKQYHYHGKIALFVKAFIIFILSRFWSKTRARLSWKQKRRLEEQKSYIISHVKPQKEKLYADYLKQSVADHDLS